MTTLAKYGLRHKKFDRILGVSLKSNDGQAFCVSTTTELDENSDEMWLVDTALNAEYVRQFSTEWYNACHETPSHSFKSEDLEVVKIEIITIEEKIDVQIPTFEKFLEIKYKDKEPQHYEYIMIQLNSDNETRSSIDRKYSLYDLEELIRNGLV